MSWPSDGAPTDAKAAALYVSNMRFAAQSTNYLATSMPSPLQHYWSLAVEEQFYLFWPLVIRGYLIHWLVTNERLFT